MDAAAPRLGAPPADGRATAPVAFGSVAATLALACGVTAAPMLAQLVSPLIGVPLAVILAFLLANHLWRFVPAVLIFAMMFQNLFVSLLSPLIPDADVFTFIRGYTFLETVVVWAVLIVDFLRAPAAHSPAIRRLIFQGLGLFAVIGAFAALGLPANGSATIVYTRNIVTPLLLFHICLLTAARARLDVGRMIVVYAGMVFACGWLEMLSRRSWLALTNGDGYWEFNAAGMRSSGYWEDVLAQTGFVYRDIEDYFRINLFNTPYFDGIEVMRLHGPNIHAIAFGYALAFLALYLIAAGRPLFAALSAPLLVLASVKGAMALLLLVVAAWVGSRAIGAARTLPVLLAVLVIYVAAMIVTGLAGGDYHVIGLMGGLKGFVALPLGHGIGSGGNLAGAITMAEWSKAQEAGSFDGAVESAIGVLLWQMGVAGLLVLAHYLAIAARAWRLYARSGNLHQGLAAFATLIVVVNGLFQEEALFSPLALGLVLAFTGLVIGSAERRPEPAPAALAVERT
ncbi:hypothetical protein EYW49_08740 [Siculibacillus lacustris]|uniref:O-antigen ligase domain-containing protein n=1 Tax=Siculibacillus lacustris TaxID=1549641 RepID=A0A4Q9VUR4_9HYPH|nr:hypothetical protein [Siculibacillus lacustris]TBW38768.1 hypothetical protein EYW49_08740 [Siculibacillus lacustris]